MTENFITQGLQEDRYLKAIRLANQFDAEIEAQLRTVGHAMINEHPELFEEPVDGSYHSRRERSSLLAHARVNFPMDRVPTPDSDEALRLNVHLYWRDPTECNRTDIDGALRAFGYKIKGLTRKNDDDVAAATRDSPLQTTKNPWDSNTVFYNHVDSKDDIERTSERLIDHFTEFGSEYGGTRTD